MQVAAILIGLVVFSTALGFLWRAAQGRIAPGAGSVADVELGASATLLQLSTELCAPCRSTARVLGDLAAPGIRHIEIDIADRPDLVRRFNVLQTPTTLILDREGTVRARIGGAVRRDLVAAELRKLVAA